MNSKKTFYTFIILISFFLSYSQTTNLIPYGSSWKYKDDGSDLGTSWQSIVYSDVLWSSGNGQFGYGDGDESTIVSYGPSSSNKYVTTYFRKNINITSSYTDFDLNVKRDDGVVVYINGVEVFRNNMPTGIITFTTLSATVASDDGGTAQSITLPASAFVLGNNLIAVEIHQAGVSSSDLTFDLELNGNLVPLFTSIVKGPYLQKSSPTSILIKWETSSNTNSKVNFGLSASSLTASVQNTVSTNKHQIELTGLTPFTKYFYNIGATIGVLQGDTNNYFLTPPVIGTPGKYRFWIVGDCGTNSISQFNVKNQYLIYNKNRVTNGWLLLGDNAYSNGFDSQYNSNFFNYYQTDIMKKTPLWPCPGNHDYNGTYASLSGVPYYDIFSLPTLGQCGGVPSNNPTYYSYTYGNVHFISLDSFGTWDLIERMSDTTSNQINWLKADLTANTSLWTVVFFHHPPYTMGSHNSDTEMDLVAIRERVMPILERYNVDLVFCGHSHVYERSKLMKGHFGNESSFSSISHNKSSSSGTYDSPLSCPYIKDSLNIKNGTIYSVNGSSGIVSTSSQPNWPHNAMHYSNNTYGGSQIFDIDNNRADITWLGEDGIVRDKYTILKNVNKVRTYNLYFGQIITLTASWPGKYIWNSTTDTTRTITHTAMSNTVIIVKDIYDCVADTFYVNILTVTQNTLINENPSLKIYPNPTKNNISVEFDLNEKADLKVVIINHLGQTVITTKTFTDIDIKDLANGNYFINVFGKNNEVLKSCKFIKE